MKKLFLLSLIALAAFVAPAQANFIAPTTASGNYTIDWTFEAHSSCQYGSVTPYKIQELDASGQILMEKFVTTKPYYVYGKTTGTYTYKLWTYLCIASGNAYYYRGSVTVQVNPVPSAPPTFQAALADPNVSLTWTKPPEPFTYYEIRRNGVSITTAPYHTATSYIDSSPVVGTNTYTIRACTTTTSGCSAWKTSNTVTVAPAVPVGSLSPELTNGVVNSALITGEPTSFVGSVAGEFRVNESGAATYNVAIKMPDGVAGVKPQINIGYSSQAGNGLLGKGWNMGGLSGISRCRRTLSQDGVASPITWTADDRFCLDGQRLMLTSGTYRVVYIKLK